MPTHVTIEGVTFHFAYTSGKAIKVGHEGREIAIPNFAIHDDSEIWKGSEEGETGKLVLTEDMAAEKGFTDPPSRSLGGGLPLKRHRLPEPPPLYPDSFLDAVMSRLREAGAGYAVDEHDHNIVIDPDSDEIIAEFVGGCERGEAELFAHASVDLAKLVHENLLLREWVRKALKTQERRKR